MKKIFTPILSILLASAGVATAQTTHTYDFTNWSAETIANLKAEDVVDTSKESGGMDCWSSWEKATGADRDKAGTDIPQTDKCYWLAKNANTTHVDADGNLTANGTVIAELKGLNFKNCGSNRQLAIAVDYPSTSLGNYNGGKYLWLGGSKISYFVIPNVKAGSTIKMGVESHKPSEGRGVVLTIGNDTIQGPAAPKTLEDQSWTVPAGDAPVDVTVKNTNGCHIYYIDVEQESANEDPGTEPEQPSAGNVFIARGDNASASIPTGGTDCKSITYNIAENTTFTISSNDGFRKATNQNITYEETQYAPIYMLSIGSGSGGDNIFNFTKSDDITKVTMYAYYNAKSGSKTVKTSADGETIFTANGFDGELASADITNYDSIYIGGGLYAIFVIEYGSGTSVVESLDAEIENVAPIYYNLNGVRVENPVNGLYIRIQGNKVDKIYVR